MPLTLGLLRRLTRTMVESWVWGVLLLCFRVSHFGKNRLLGPRPSLDWEGLGKPKSGPPVISHHQTGAFCVHFSNSYMYTHCLSLCPSPQESEILES